MNRFAMLALASALLSLGCGDKDGDTGGSDDGAACGSTEGFVYGVVTGPYDSAPNPDATVYATSTDGETEVADLDGTGDYELNLAEGHWTVYGDAYGCWSDDHGVDVVACEEIELDVEVLECDTADKPNLYLYPGIDTPTVVTLGHTQRQRIVASVPGYQGAWRGIAHTDGTWTAAGTDQRDPFLFYEVSLQPWQSARFQRDVGWCVEEGQAHEAMAEILGAYGFNAGERDDFVDAWVHDLPPSDGGYAVYPQVDVEHAATVQIQPALPLSRLWLVVEPGAGCSAGHEPAVLPFDRSGPHAVEWGVVLHGLVR